MPFDNSLSRLDTCRITIDTGSINTQLFMSMWKLRKRLFKFIDFRLVNISLFIRVGHDKYGRTLIQVCSALPDKWPIIDWLLKQKKVDINTKNLESGYTVTNCFTSFLNSFQ